MMRLSLSLLPLVLLASVCSSSTRADLVASTINFLAADASDAAGVLRFDETTGVELSLGDVPPFAALAGPFGPTDIAVGPDGNIYITDAFTSSVLFFGGKSGDPLTSPIGGLDGLYTGIAPTGGLTFTSLAFGDDGRLYVADASISAVRVYDGPNGATPGVQVDTLLDSPSSPVVNIAAVTFDQNGDLLVSDRDGGKVHRVDVTTDSDQVIISAGVGGLFAPVGMEVDDSGNIFVANLFGSSILKYDTDGNNGALFADVPLVAGDVDGGSFPSDLILDREGDLLVAVLGGNNVIGSGEGRIVRFDSDGTLLETLADGLVPVSSVALIDDVLPGDFDGDGTVDEEDYALWNSQYDDKVTPTHGADANGDSLVDVDDFTIWRDTLGATGIAASGSLISVPEPNAITLVVLGAVILLSRKRPPLAA